MLLLFLSSGLFLGWSLGANDAANVFGSAVGSRMVSFRKAAIIASVFVILGAVLQGAGASHTLGKLGKVDAMAGAFTVALAAAITVYWMTKMRMPVSTSQAIVGSIIGWNLFTGNPTDSASMTKIVTTWIAGPILGALFAVFFFIVLQAILRKAKFHLVKLDAYIRNGLIIVGAFGAYSLGANNIANVVGVFLPLAPELSIDLGFMVLDGTQQLFLMGGIAISIGIITYSRKVMETVGSDLMELTSEAALVVVLSQAAVLFIFSSTSLSNLMVSMGLPPIPLVPVSSSQVVVGSVIGIGLYKGGGKNIRFRVLGGITMGWITTPLAAGLISFISLFFVNNVFKLDVTNPQNEQEIENEIPKFNGNEVDIMEETKSVTNTAYPYSLLPKEIDS
ncbi:MAG: inorganic phosphate transporter [Bacteroidales bacterium]|nr:inorganic phosphate transporter [Bacteroidales bacterium]